MTDSSFSLECQFDQYGRLRQPSLHDAEIMSFKMADVETGRALTISVRLESGDILDVHFTGCRSVCFKGFLSQNKINDVERLDSDHLIANFERYRPDLGVEHESDNAKRMKDISDNDLQLIEIVSSVGAHVSCICAKLEVFPRDQVRS